MTLLILFCKMSEHMDILYAFYASDRDDAEQHASMYMAFARTSAILCGFCDFFLACGSVEEHTQRKKSATQ